MKVAAVILNWNTEALLRRYLPALLSSCEEFGSGAEVIVADSASSDGSLDVLASQFPEVKTVPLDANYGFAGGYNRALARVDAEYYILVNSDIDVPRDWLLPLVDWMDSHPECGICGPKLHAIRDGKRCSSFEYAGAAGGYVDRFGYPFCRGRVLSRTEEDRGQYDTPAEVLWVSGACLMIRSSLWRELGGFDERFFAHMEEIDLCWRACRAGWKVCVVPGSTVWHLGGGTLPPSSPWKLELNYRNNLLLLHRNDGSALTLLVRRTLDLGSALVYLLTGRREYCRAVLKAHRAFRAFGLGRVRKVDQGPGLSPRHRMRRLCILPLSFVKGQGIFKYLKRYEDCH